MVIIDYRELSDRRRDGDIGTHAEDYIDIVLLRDREQPWSKLVPSLRSSCLQFYSPSLSSLPGNARSVNLGMVTVQTYPEEGV